MEGGGKHEKGGGGPQGNRERAKRGKRSEGWSRSLGRERIMKVRVYPVFGSEDGDKRREGGGGEKRWDEKRRRKDGDGDGKQRWCELEKK